MKLFNCFMKKGIVYVPTVILLTSGPYKDVEPVAAVPVANIDGLRRALLGTIARGNVAVTPTPELNRAPPVLLKYTGDRNWSAFKRGASYWVIKEDDGRYKIAGHRTHRMGYWEQDPEQTIEFPPEATIDDVVDRMIAILQQAAQKRAGE